MTSGPALSEEDLDRFEREARSGQNMTWNELAADALLLARDLRLFRSIVLTPRKSKTRQLAVELTGLVNNVHYCEIVNVHTRVTLAKLELSRDEFEDLALSIGGDRG